jgi:hypothetical protein
LRVGIETGLKISLSIPLYCLENDDTMMVHHHLPLVLLLLCCLSFHASGSRVNITNNGYRDIVIAISPDVKADHADDLLDKIKVFKLISYSILIGPPPFLI